MYARIRIHSYPSYVRPVGEASSRLSWIDSAISFEKFSERKLVNKASAA